MCTRSIATRAILLAATLTAGTAAAPIQAQERADAAPAEPPVVIDAERSYYDLRSGVTRFEENVSITRGPMAVEADRGVVRQTEGQITEVELEGAPSTWRDRLEDGSVVTGEASDIRFDVLANVITLTGNAIIRHEQGEFTGDELVYDLTAESLAGRSTGDERVRVIIEPEAMSDPRPTGTPAPQDNAAESTPESTRGDGRGAETAGENAAAAQAESEPEPEPDPEPPAEDPPADPDGR